MPDIALSLRARYTAARAALIVANKIIEDLKTQAMALQEAAGRASELRSRAEAVTAELHAFAKDLEIDVSDEAIGSALDDEIVKAQRRAQDEIVALRSTRPMPRSVPTRGQMHQPVTPASPAAAGVRPPGPAGPSGEPAGTPPPEPPREAPAANGAARKPGPDGQISTVTPRAARALRRVAKPAVGEVGRAAAMQDDEGRAIPVDEQLVIDDDAPVADAAAPQDGDKGVGTIPPPPEDPPETR